MTIKNVFLDLYKSAQSFEIHAEKKGKNEEEYIRSASQKN